MVVQPCPQPVKGLTGGCGEVLHGCHLTILRQILMNVAKLLHHRAWDAGPSQSPTTCAERHVRTRWWCARIVRSTATARQCGRHSCGQRMTTGGSCGGRVHRRVCGPGGCHAHGSRRNWWVWHRHRRRHRHRWCSRQRRRWRSRNEGQGAKPRIHKASSTCSALGCVSGITSTHAVGRDATLWRGPCTHRTIGGCGGVSGAGLWQDDACR